ncbi:SprT-like family-domain-containing protein [Annulohypoxylon nitens]|nr:SprT-like family-domain-containing protein [Annulohypoxylon nitens]
MPDMFGDSSEDEFPDVDVLVRNYRQKVQGKQEEPGAKDSTSRKERDAINTPAVKSIPLRRRKLGQTQTADQTLLKPWGKTVASNEEKGQSSNPRVSRARVRVKEEIIEPNFSSRDIPVLKPKVPRQEHRDVSSGTDLRSISKGAEKRQEDYNVKTSSEKARPVPKKLTKNPMPSDESSEESDMLEDIKKSSEEEESEEEEWEEGEEEDEDDEEEDVSEFVSESDSDSETDTWNSDSEHSVTPPTRRSRSPTVQSSKPQRTLFKGLDKNAAPSNKQPQATTINPTNRPSKQREALKTLKAPQSGNLEDTFQKLQIFNEDSEPEKPSTKRDKKPILEPTTPKKTLKTIPISPLKTPKIPASPWKPEHKEFWDSEVHFGWVDKHSPDKKLEKKPDNPQKLKPKLTEKELRLEAMRKYATSPEKKLERKAFDLEKHSLARSFLQELDDRITNGELSKLTADTGGLKITWSQNLLTTAGRANWKCKMQSTMVKDANGVMTEKLEKREHSGSIELSSRVLGNRSDLLNTVAHEFCHLAVFILIGKPKLAHGADFKSFGAKCENVFRDRGIVVTTKHDYKIEFKYIWECEGCHRPVMRHSRSVDVVRQRCGVCRGVLRQIMPPPRGTGASTPTTTPSGGANGANGSGGAGPPTAKKKPTAWNEFLSQEMKALSKENPKMSFRDKMAAASSKWANMQREKKQETCEKTMKELQTAVKVLDIHDKTKTEEEEEEEEEDGADRP